MENERSGNKIIIKTMEEVMHESMIPYSEHVILDRALPRVEDGLKPVQRRILFTMLELGITPDKPYRKSARIVGDCLGKYHPHGDKSVYDAMVRMAQSFNMRSILVDGHGNFGSVDGDSAAAMRYTEARLTPLAMELLRDLEKDTVRWSCNFDDTLKEPETLPGRFPNLLVNGASGIAVGLATNIPPHNITEVIDGVIAYIDYPSISLDKMMRIIKGPDFPTGGFMIAGSELYRAYETGRGKVQLRAKINIEVAGNDKRNIVITELPYQVNKSTLLETILTLREDKKGVLSGISEICDESDRNGMRAVIRVKKDCDPRAICEVLFKSTNLSTSFAFNVVAIADGKPQQMGLLDIIAYYVDYQRGVVLRRTRYDLEQAKEREHILTGLVIAVKNIDEVIKIIKAASSVNEARQNLRARFELSERQAQAILDMRLARLTHLEIYKLENELKEVRALIAALTKIVSSKREQLEVVKSELLAVRKTFKEPRRTEIIDNPSDYYIPAEDDDKPVEDYMISVNAYDCVKRIGQKSFNISMRDFTESSTKHEIASVLQPLKSNELLYCFTNLGNCYKIEPDIIPDGKWREKGTPPDKFITGFNPGERIIYARNIGENFPKGSLLFFSRKGMIKKSEWSELNVLKSTYQAVKLNDGDEIINIEQDERDTSVLFVTASGICLNADKSDVPVQGRIAAGVKGIKLDDNDSVVAAEQITSEGEAVLITSAGLSKRVVLSSLDIMGRYRKGVKIIELKDGESVAHCSAVCKPYTLVVEDSNGYLQAFSTEDISIESRTAKGRPLNKGKMQVEKVFIYKN